MNESSVWFGEPPPPYRRMRGHAPDGHCSVYDCLHPGTMSSSLVNETAREVLYGGFSNSARVLSHAPRRKLVEGSWTQDKLKCIGEELPPMMNSRMTQNDKQGEHREEPSAVRNDGADGVYTCALKSIEAAVEQPTRLAALPNVDSQRWLRKRVDEPWANSQSKIIFGKD